MSEPLMLLLLGIGLLFIATIAKKIIKTPDTPPGYAEETRKGIKDDLVIHPELGGSPH